MKMQLNAPPNWPTPPRGWTPPGGWQPDPAWGPPPAGWPLWVIGPENGPARSSHYGLLALSVAICLTGSLILIQIGRSLGVDDLLSQLGLSPVLAAPKLHRSLVHRLTSDQDDSATRSARSVGLSIIYGALILAAALQVAGGLAGYMAAQSSDLVSTYVAVAAPLSLVTVVVTVGLIGMYAGAHATRHSWAVPVGAAALGEALGVSLAVIVQGLGLDDTGLIEGVLSAGMVVSALAQATLIGLIVGVPANRLGKRYEPRTPRNQQTT